jgi:chemotaxis protein CheD
MPLDIRSGRRPTIEGDFTSGAYFDPKFDAYAVKVLPGEFVVTTEDVMLVTVLGSCVSACARDVLAGVGGMNHFMLPEGEADGSAGDSARYGSYAMEMLLNGLYKRGARRDRLEVKLFGGDSVLQGFTANPVGERNAKFAREFLEAERIRVVAQDLGDIFPRRVHYFPLSGRVLVKRLPSANLAEVSARETQYRQRLRAKPQDGSVELF